MLSREIAPRPLPPSCVVLLAFVLQAAALVPTSAAQAQAQAQAQALAQGAGTDTFPRFASLKADRVNVRRGPGQEHAIDWVYRRAGLPVEVMAASDQWRRVRDSEGATGWVLASLLSSRRTVLIEPWEVKNGVAQTLVGLKSDDSERASDVAQVEAGVIANIKQCDGRWCRVGVANFSGYVPQERLWGVYKGEVLR